MRNLFRSAFDALLLKVESFEKISSPSDFVLDTIGGSEVLSQGRPPIECMMRFPLVTSVITSTASARVAASIPRCFTASKWKRTQTPQLFITETR